MNVRWNSHDVEITCQNHRKVEEYNKWAIDRARSLLYDRHLDNTVLCVLYGVAKVMRAKPEVSFKKIIAAHKKCNGAKLEIIRHVILNSPNERRWFNSQQSFYSQMKSYLLSLTPSSSSSSSTTKRHPRLWKRKRKERSEKEKEGKEEKKSWTKIRTTTTLKWWHPRKKIFINRHKRERENDADAEPLQRMNVFVVPRRVHDTKNTRYLCLWGKSKQTDGNRRWIPYSFPQSVRFLPVRQQLTQVITTTIFEEFA